MSKESLNNRGEPIIYNRSNENLAMPAYVTVDKRFRFSAGASKQIGLEVGKFIHLLEFGGHHGDPTSEVQEVGEWYLMVDDDKDNGMKLCAEGDHIVAHAQKVCNIFIRRARLTLGSGKSVSFYISRTSFEWKGKTLWMIDLDRPFNSMVGKKFSRHKKFHS